MSTNIKSSSKVQYTNTFAKKVILAILRSRFCKKSFIWIENKTNFALERYRFRKKMGYKLSIEDPKSFNEKITMHKLTSAGDLYVKTADKYLVRTYVEEKLGKEEAREVLVPLLFAVEDVSEIPFANLPEEYIIKMNNNSGANIFVVKDTDLTADDIKMRCAKWLQNTIYGFYKHEWIYSQMTPKVIGEKLIRDEKGDIPRDYKFHMVNGKCIAIQIVEGRFYGLKKAFLDADWNYLPGTLADGSLLENAKRPPHLEKMLSIATKLAEDFEYVRVDLYYINQKVYFGELTHFPLNGNGRFTPTEFDFYLGNRW